jgi:hypothetical protein
VAHLLVGCATEFYNSMAHPLMGCAIEFGDLGKKRIFPHPQPSTRSNFISPLPRRTLQRRRRRRRAPPRRTVPPALVPPPRSCRPRSCPRSCRRRSTSPACRSTTPRHPPISAHLLFLSNRGATHRIGTGNPSSSPYSPPVISESQLLVLKSNVVARFYSSLDLSSRIPSPGVVVW